MPLCSFVYKTAHWRLITLSLMLSRCLGNADFSFMSNEEVKGGMMVVFVMQLKVKSVSECN